MGDKKKTLNEVTAGDLSEIFENLRKDGFIFRADFSQISKRLLKECLSINPFSEDFQTLVISYLEHIEFDKKRKDKFEDEIFKDFRNEERKRILAAIENEKDFHKYICKNYFDLKREPKEELLEAFNKSSNL
ncbi:hypothetical protein [Sphingobacterium sp. UBA6320]|uniref:hypothetical protein n=1 Tax=Sphingobacterium sp. UBA6320 TaxID=1947510 RepID=UPI0025D91668|nr:hypothetical protein [Sphingobacterium sp. UBA6320]